MILTNIKRAPQLLGKLQKNVKFPEKFKGTIIEKWADYWKNLFVDYRQMLQDLRSDIQEKPQKTFLWATGLVSIYMMSQNNPDEVVFKDTLKRITNEVILVSEDCRNPKTVEHLRHLDKSYNECVIHYKNLGIASIVYISELNDSCDLYKTQCAYLKPTLLSFPSRIVDVGFLGKWWNLYIKTTNYDVNL